PLENRGKAGVTGAGRARRRPSGSNLARSSRPKGDPPPSTSINVACVSSAPTEGLHRGRDTRLMRPFLGRFIWNIAPMSPAVDELPARTGHLKRNHAAFTRFLEHRLHWCTMVGKPPPALRSPRSRFYARGQVDRHVIDGQLTK